MSAEDAGGAVAAEGGGRGAWWVVLVSLAALLPFLGKAYTIDDTLFLDLAHHLREDPLDFYGFDVNWYGTVEPMHGVTMNPPLGGYYLAAVTALLGWGEPAVHAAFLLPALAAALGAWALARRFTTRPVTAALVGVLTPVFLVSSTNVMCDTTMLAFWSWALFLWVRGVDEERPGSLWAAATLAALAALTKYFAVALLPLFVVHGLARRRRLGRWLLPLVLPVLVLIGYQVLTHAWYGRGLLGNAASYAIDAEGERKDWDLLNRTVVGLSFVGGCLVPLLFLAPFFVSRRTLLGAVLAVPALVLLLSLGTRLEDLALEPLAGWPEDRSPPWINRTLVVQLALFVVAGSFLLGLAVRELRTRTPEGWLLGLWFLGTLVFAAYLNWVNNGRSNLPLAPLCGILIVRAVEARRPGSGSLARPLFLGAALPAFALALLVARADLVWANRNRDAAREICELYVGDQPLWFQGHWGFQYYMELGGAQALDYQRRGLVIGEIVAAATNNSFIAEPYTRAEPIHEIVPDLVQEKGRRRPLHRPMWFHTLAHGIGAGFYASNIGPMPWVVGHPWPPDIFRVWRMTENLRFSSPPERFAE